MPLRRVTLTAESVLVPCSNPMFDVQSYLSMLPCYRCSITDVLYIGRSLVLSLFYLFQFHVQAIANNTCRPQCTRKCSQRDDVAPYKCSNEFLQSLHTLKLTLPSLQCFSTIHIQISNYIHLLSPSSICCSMIYIYIYIFISPERQYK